MRFKTINSLAGIALLCAFSLSCSKNKSPETIGSRDFLTPPQNVKVNTWWHWLDGNITKEGITKDLEAMKAQGIVQATILNVGLFGEKDFGIPKVKFGSDQWFEMFRWALHEADRLDIKLGAHNCDGWSSSGGPWITPEMSMKQFVWTKTIIKGGQKVSANIKKPYSLRNFYKDVAIIAYKTKETVSSFQVTAEKISLNDSIDAFVLKDGNPVSAVAVKKGDNLTISTAEPISFDKIAIHPRRSFMWGNADDFMTTYTLSVLEEGKLFRKISYFTVKGLNKTEYAGVPLTKARFVRITVDAISDIDSYIPFEIAELELLKGNEKAFYSPSIPFISEKTGSVKANGEEVFYTSGSVKNIPLGKDIINLTGKMSADGKLEWDAPQGNWTVLRFGYTTTGATNGPATKEGVGLECDKMDSAAIDFHFRNFPDKLIKQAGKYAGNTFKFILIDSWECAFQNWTAGFPSEFEKRRGYSLIPYLPVLCGEIVNSPEESEAVLFDFRRTIAELIEQNYYERFSDLCHNRKIEMHAEVIYGGAQYPPLDILKSTRCVDLPMYEFWTSTDKDMFVKYRPQAGPEFNMPSCAVIGYDKHVLGSEAYTGMAHYSESPQELKSFGDRAFCSGINQMILHSNVHQPTDKKPGMTLGQFGSHFNRNNLLWQYISGWLDYQSRIQYVLQKGNTEQDVLYYLGDQLPQYYQNNQSNSLPFGYQVNACNYDILKNRVKLIDGKLRLNNASEYSLLSLPAFPYMDFETLKLIDSLVKGGAVVYGPKPLRTLSKVDLRDNLTTFNKLAEMVWGKVDGITVKENSYGKGKVFWGMPIGEVLKMISLPPDFSTDLPDLYTFQFIHKKQGDKDVYFVANQKDSIINRECKFRIVDKIPEIWNPEDGSVLKPADFRIEKGVIRIPFTFKPRQSVIFVFNPVNRHDNNTPVQKKIIIPVKKDQIGEMEITGFKGTIQFEAAYPALIFPVKISELKSLSDFDDPDIRYFAGYARYIINFKVPKGFYAGKEDILLNVGKFDSDADVILNGKSLGRIWNPGTELNICGLLKADNQMIVTIATVYRNRFIGDFIQSGGVKNLWTSSPITQFLDMDKPLKPSGLIGPLRLIKISGTRSK